MTQHYIGTKQVTAWPQERNGEPGYAVKYADGYTSWSPAAAFESAYLAIGHVGHMPAHLQRVVGEARQLSDRLSKLREYLRGAVSANLPQADRELMQRQDTAMEQYLSVLTERMGDYGVASAEIAAAA